MAFCASVRHAFWHRIWFTPNNILPQIPTVRLQGKGYPPGIPQRSLGLRLPVLRGFLPRYASPRLSASFQDHHRHCRTWIFRCRPCLRSRLHSCHLNSTKASHHPAALATLPGRPEPSFQRRLRGAFKAELSVNAIISQSPIRRRSHATLNGFLRQSRQNVEAITLDNHTPSFSFPSATHPAKSHG